MYNYDCSYFEQVKYLELVCFNMTTNAMGILYYKLEQIARS